MNILSAFLKFDGVFSSAAYPSMNLLVGKCVLDLYLGKYESIIFRIALFSGIYGVYPLSPKILKSLGSSSGQFST